MGRQKRTGPSKKSVPDPQPTKKKKTKAREDRILTPANLPPRPTSRKSRRVRGLSPLPSGNSPSPTGAAPSPKNNALSKSKQKPRGKPRKRKEPPPPYPGHSYNDKATQTELQDATRERATQTDHKEATRTAAWPVYSDPIERWVMNNAQPEQAAVADAPMVEPLHGQRAYQHPPSHPSTSQASTTQASTSQPAPSNPPRGRKRKNQERSTSKAADSSTAIQSSSGTIYKKADFADLLESRSLPVKLFMREHSHGQEEGVDKANEVLLNSLDTKFHNPPNEPQYDAKALQMLLKGLSSKNEVMVIHELHDLVCPPAERLSIIYSEDNKLGPIYKKFVDYRDEPWTKPPQLIAGFPEPKPDYCVGFKEQVFDDHELDVLAMVPNVMRSFMTAGKIYFPFLTCEAKSPKELVKFAENQNAYAMMVAVSSTFDLFRAAGKEQSVHRKVLGFSISYNDRTVLVDGYYPVVTGRGLSIYRTRRFEMFIPPTDSDTRRSWRFVRNIYEVWAPLHLQDLKDAIKAVQPLDNVAGSGSRGSQTPTPSEATHRRLQQLGLQSSRPQAARVGNDSVSSDQSRAGGVAIAPSDRVSPKRQKTTAV